MEVKSKLIGLILAAVKERGTPVTGEMFISLAFRSESELRKICKELRISTK